MKNFLQKLRTWLLGTDKWLKTNEGLLHISNVRRVTLRATKLHGVTIHFTRAFRKDRQEPWSRDSALFNKKPSHLMPLDKSP